MFLKKTRKAATRAFAAHGKLERSLARIARARPEKEKYDTFGIILDTSDPYRLEGKEYYVTKLKIVDASFNFQEIVENREIKIQNYAVVYIKNLNAEDAPQVKSVGTVIRLRRFNFQINEQGELYAIMVEFSNWLLIGQTRNGLTIEDRMERQSNETRQLSEYEAEQAKNLYSWARTLLERYSLRTILWWNALVEPNSSAHAAARHIAQHSVDLILRVARVEFDARRITFADERGNAYFLTMESAVTVKENCFVKLRSFDVKFAVEGRILNPRVTSSCLLLPDWCFDARLFEPEFHRAHADGVVVSRERKLGDSDQFLRRQAVLDIYPALDDFYFEDLLLGRKSLLLNPPSAKIESPCATLVRKAYTNRAPTPLESFAAIAGSDCAKLLHQKFVLLISISEPPKTVWIVRQCALCRKTRKCDAPTKCCRQTTAKSVITQIIVCDSSVERALPIYAVTRNGDLNPFLLWKLSLFSQSEDESLAQFKAKLAALPREKEAMKVVVEVKSTEKGEMFFEVCDTLFMP